MTEFKVELNKKLSIPSEFETIYVYESKWNFLILNTIVFGFVFYNFKLEKILIESLIICILLFYFDFKKLYRIVRNFPYLVVFKNGLIYKGKTYYWEKMFEELKFDKDSENDYSLEFFYESKRIFFRFNEPSDRKTEQTIQNIFCFKNKIYR